MKTNLQGDTRHESKGDTRHTFQKRTPRGAKNNHSKARETSLPLQRERPDYRRQQELRLQLRLRQREERPPKRLEE